MTSAFGDQKVPMMTSARNVGEGWHQLLHELEAALNAIDPDFTLQQVKEKFGGLRYYATTEKKGDLSDLFHTEIRVAEQKSTHICEECGEPGETHSIHGWYRTLCDQHETELRRKRQQELDELQRDHGGQG